MSQSRGKEFEALLTIRAPNERAAQVIWCSICPNVSRGDIEEGCFGAELRGHEMIFSLKDESASRIRAKLTSLLVWAKTACDLFDIDQPAPMGGEQGVID